MSIVKILILIVAVTVSVGKNCYGMQHSQTLGGQSHGRFIQPSKPTARSVGKQCLCDGLKTTIGVSALGASLFAALAASINCNMQPEYMNTPEKMLCSEAGSLTILTVGGASVLYIGYQMVNLAKHSCELAKLTAEPLFNRLVQEIRLRYAQRQYEE